jgi:hypothetical protein
MFKYSKLLASAIFLTLSCGHQDPESGGGTGGSGFIVPMDGGSSGMSKVRTALNSKCHSKQFHQIF